MLHQSINLNRFKKRERTQNWAYEEKRFLLELCKKDINIIENKRLDADLTALKNRAWKIIHQEFAKSFGNERNCNRLKEQWRRMKACTRAEVMDYQHRLSRYGQDVADKKRPNSFTFEIWDFMQEAKKLCRSDALEGIDYSKVQLSLEDGITTPDMHSSGLSVESDDDTSLWQKGSQNICEVEIKEESGSDEQDNLNAENEQTDADEYDDGPSAAKRPYSIVNSLHQAHATFLSKQQQKQQQQHSVSSNNISVTGGGDDDAPSLSINNVAATLDTLKMIKNGQFGHNNNATSKTNINTSYQNGNRHHNNGDIDDEYDKTTSAVKQLMNMQNKEHNLRMEILQTQLETAKYNRDLAEINKMIAIRNLGTLGVNGQNNL